jgi:hypothetical protein
MVAMTADTGEFAHGTYADDSGVVFYGPPVKGFWEDFLEVSDKFIDPLFRAILDRAWGAEGSTLPAVVAQWNELTGWRDATGMVELSPADARELVGALANVSEADLAPHLVAGLPVDAYLRCATVTAEFLRDRLDRGVRVYIADE